MISDSNNSGVMDTPGRLTWLVERVLPPLMAVVVGWWVLRASGTWLVDDAFISFRYARNLAHGLGLTWNPGVPVEGYTNLLWVLLLTPFAWLDIDLIIPSAVMGILFQVLTLVLMGHVIRRCFPRTSPWLRLVPPLLVATHLQWAFWTVSGMETASFVFWVLLSVHLAVRGREPGKRSWLLGFSLVAAYLTRPEGAMVAALVMGWELLSAWQDAARHERMAALRRRWRRLWFSAALLGAVMAVHVTLRLWYYGVPLPNTFYAKVIPGGTAIWRGLSHLRFFFLQAAGILTLPGVFLLWRLHRRRRGGATPAEARTWAYLVHGYVLLFVYLFYIVIIGGDLPVWARFYLPLMPLPLVALGGLLVELERWLRPRGHHVAGMALVLCVGGIMLLQQWLSAPVAVVGIEVSRYIQERNTGLRRLFFRPQVPTDALLAIDAVGAFGYYLPNRIIDTWGLNDPVIAHRRVRPRAGDMFAHEKADWYYVLHLHPDYIIESLHIPALRGYDPCWINGMAKPVHIWRRNYPLRQDQRGLGMPPGVLRDLQLPPPCKRPYTGLGGLRRFENRALRHTTGP